MTIVRQLADWLLEHDRISPDRYVNVLSAILGEDNCCSCDWELFGDAIHRQSERDEDDDATDAWWNLRGAGERARGKAARRRGGGRRTAKAKPIRIEALDPRLPVMLFPPDTTPAAFPLAALFRAVDEACGNRRPDAGWEGFAAAAAALYKADAETLHDALRAAMAGRGRELGPLLAAMETGDTLFPDDLLDGLSGESVTALRKRIDGDETRHAFVAKDWILRYPSFKTLNEACLVRNRLRRIYRLWVLEFAEFADFVVRPSASGLRDSVVRRAASGFRSPGFFLAFGKTRVPVPFGVWVRLHGSGVAQCFPSLNVLAVEKSSAPAGRGSDPMLGQTLNFSLDGSPAMAVLKGDSFVAAEPVDWWIDTIPDKTHWILRPLEVAGRRSPRIAPPADAGLLWASPKQLVDDSPQNLDAFGLWPWKTLLTDGWLEARYDAASGWYFYGNWRSYLRQTLSKHPEVVERIGWTNLPEHIQKDLLILNRDAFSAHAPEPSSRNPSER